MKNVLLVVADQWRGDCLGALGHPCVRTPNLDALAADGVLFEAHYGQASPCGPARASLFTGMYLQNHRSVRNGTPLDARFTNLALEARRAGYDPVLFGYTDTSPDPRRHDPADPALRTYEGILPGLTPVAPLVEDLWPWLAGLRAKGYPLPANPRDIYRPAGPPPVGRSLAFAPPIYSAADSDTAFLTDQVLKSLSVRREPWCAVLCYIRPHPPWIAPEPYNALIDPADVPLPLPAAAPPDHPWLAHVLERQPGSQLIEGEDLDWRDLCEDDVRQLRATYYGLIAELDANLGRIIDALKASGAYDDTLIVFTADHGEQLGDHGLFGKESWFDPTFHLPLIIRDPRPEASAARGTRVEAFSEAIDLMPTVLDWLGCDVPRQCDGRSLLPFLEGRTPQGWRQEAHFELDFRDVADRRTESELGLAMDACSLGVLRGRQYKYVHFAGLPPLLFDLHEDLGERRNLASDPSLTPVMLDCAQKLLSWRMENDERVLTGLLLTPDGVIERRR